ncbi:ATP-binding protein [Cellulomonas fimi]|uniref:histidine kinase n=1 Tax=Cellulomonas fimi TaxID=1708 RepID=A0A7Y0QIT1_CELFI|nr:ATP-binding protein [Cellulomonas fimi]NMR20627.1 HAMP domain-containing protein [Cellulomonas fimi]
MSALEPSSVRAAAPAGSLPGAMTLSKRLTRTLVATGVLLGLVGATAVVATVQVVERQRDVTTVYFQALTAAESTFIQLVDAETAIRGYAQTGDPVLLESYERVMESSVDDRWSEVEARVGADSPLARSREAAIEDLQHWFRTVALPTIEKVGAEGADSVSPAELAAGAETFAVSRESVSEYLGELRDARHDAVRGLQRWTQVLVAAIAVLIGAAVVVGVLISLALRRWVVRPLDSLAHDARVVSSGHLTHPITVTGPGEIAVLARDMESMRRDLVRQVDQLAVSSAELAATHQQLTEQAEDLRRSNRDLEQFAYVASHDLQEPLRKVASFTQLLQKRYGGQLDERADQYIEFAVDGAKRMQRLIQDLLGFSRVGRVGGETVDVDMASALDEALSNLHEAVTESGAVVTHGELPVVPGERALLVQLLQNLVGNGIKFRDPDRAPRVHVEARRVGESWEFVCRDNGIGIDAQYAERVFVIFQRLHPKDVYEGTGIGLSLCKRIVEYHGGHIWVDAHADGARGTSVRWALPAARPADPTEATVPAVAH